MQFTTVRSKEKDFDIYLKSKKLVHSQQEHEKNVSQLFGSGKIWFLAISNITNTVASISKEKKVDPCYLETKKCSSQLLGARKKIMTSIQSQKNWFTASRSKKKCFPAIWKWKNLVPIYIEPVKHCCSYLEREKSVSLLFGDQKMQFTTVRNKEKDYDIYLKSEKLVHSQQEHKKMFPSYLEVEKTRSQLFRA